MEVRKYEFSKVTSMQSPYAVYRELIGKKVPEPVDDSRRDVMIVLWMRAAGYTVYAVADEMFRKARPLREE